MIKIRHFRQQPCPSAVWLELFALYRHAEQGKLLSMQIKPYAEAPATSIDAYFVHACMLDTLQRCNMNRQQFELAGEPIKHLAPKQTSSAEYQAKNISILEIWNKTSAAQDRHVSIKRYMPFLEFERNADTDRSNYRRAQAEKITGLACIRQYGSHPNLGDVITMIKNEWLHYQA